MNHEDQSLNGTIIIDGNYYFPLCKIYQNLKYYFLSENGMEVWSFYNNPKKLSNYNGDYVKLNRTSYKVSSIFKQVKPLFKLWMNAVEKHKEETKSEKTSSDEFINQIDEIINRTNKTLFDSPDNKGFVICTFNEKNELVSFFKKKYSSEIYVKEECERLAKLNPGIEFIYLEIKGVCKSGINWS